eukprot:2203408-Rhodomonas_salina.1
MAGPCQASIFGDSNDEEAYDVLLMMMETSLARASSAFWISSLKIPTPSAYISRICFRRPVSDSV